MVCSLPCRVGSFRGSDELALEKRFHCCVRTAEYIKSLPHHTYEVDISHTEDHSKVHVHVDRQTDSAQRIVSLLIVLVRLGLK